MKKAIYINFFSKYSVVFFQLLLNFILARIVSPKDYGIIAVIAVFTSFFAIFSDAGIGAGVVQFKDLKENDFSHLYSMTVYLGIVLSVLFVAVGFGVSLIYDNQVYIPLSILLTISIFFNTVNTVPKAILMREKRFLEVAVRTVLITVVSGIITIALAYMGLRYYAVAAFSVLQAFLSFLWNRLRSNIRFFLLFDVRPAKVIFSFSVFQFFFNFINYFSVNTDTLLVGKKFGDVQAGLYNKSYQLITYPGSMFAGIITPILHPVLSEYQNEEDVLYDYLIKILRVLLYISVFVSGLCFLAPKEIIFVLYGDKWESAIMAFKFLSLSIVTKVCNSITGSFFQSLGKTKLLFYTGMFSAILIVGFTIVGVFYGSIESVAIFVSVAYMINFWLAYYMLIVKGFKYRFGKFIKIIIKPYIIYMILILSGNFFVIPDMGAIIGLLLKTVMILVEYIILLVLFSEHKNMIGSLKLIFLREENDK